MSKVHQVAGVPLHIPDGINYECTGCGKCCSGWSVPMTADDYERISAIDWGARKDKFAGRTLFRDLPAADTKNSPYTNAIKVGDDGFCPFLVDNLCYIHSQFESKTKPSICQLFPYCFNETPSGYYASISFVSVGAVKNAGRALTEQADYLEQKLGEFKTMYPDHHPNWSAIEFVKQMPMTWDEYLAHEAKLFEFLAARDQPLKMRLASASIYLQNVYRKHRGVAEIDAEPPADLGKDSDKYKLKSDDVRLLSTLHKLYFPLKQQTRGDSNFSAAAFMLDGARRGVLAPLLGKPNLKLITLHGTYSLDQLLAMPLNEDADKGPIEDMLYRYLFSRIFGKLYFGAGYGQLSLMAGFHHLVAVYALIKLQARAIALGRGESEVSESDMVACLRQVEKRLGDSSLDGYGAAVFELLFQSKDRCFRFLANS
jgi:Fe-S-cluster containining protein